MADRPLRYGEFLRTLAVRQEELRPRASAMIRRAFSKSERRAPTETVPIYKHMQEVFPETFDVDDLSAEHIRHTITALCDPAYNPTLEEPLMHSHFMAEHIVQFHVKDKGEANRAVKQFNGIFKGMVRFSLLGVAKSGHADVSFEPEKGASFVPLPKTDIVTQPGEMRHRPRPVRLVFDLSQSRHTGKLGGLTDKLNQFFDQHAQKGHSAIRAERSVMKWIAGDWSALNRNVVKVTENSHVYQNIFMRIYSAIAVPDITNKLKRGRLKAQSKRGAEPASNVRDSLYELTHRAAMSGFAHAVALLMRERHEIPSAQELEDRAVEEGLAKIQRHIESRGFDIRLKEGSTWGEFPHMTGRLTRKPGGGRKRP